MTGVKSISALESSTTDPGDIIVSTDQSESDSEADPCLCACAVLMENNEESTPTTTAGLNQANVGEAHRVPKRLKVPETSGGSGGPPADRAPEFQNGSTAMEWVNVPISRNDKISNQQARKMCSMEVLRLYISDCESSLKLINGKGDLYTPQFPDPLILLHQFGQQKKIQHNYNVGLASH